MNIEDTGLRPSYPNIAMYITAVSVQNLFS